MPNVLEETWTCYFKSPTRFKNLL